MAGPERGHGSGVRGSQQYCDCISCAHDAGWGMGLGSGAGMDVGMGQNGGYVSMGICAAARSFLKKINQALQPISWLLYCK